MESWQIALIIIGVIFVASIIIVLLSNLIDKNGLRFKKIKTEDMDKYYDRNEILKNQTNFYTKNKK